MRGNGRYSKKRSGQTYHNKIRKITNWYNSMEKNRQPKNAKGEDKKPLKPLSFFTDKVKKSTGEK